MTCTLCGTSDRSVRFVAAGNNVTLCENCVTACHDFFGATEKMPFDKRPTRLEPRSAWDKRSESTPTLFERRRD